MLSAVVAGAVALSSDVANAFGVVKSVDRMKLRKERKALRVAQELSAELGYGVMPEPIQPLRSRVATKVHDVAHVVYTTSPDDVIAKVKAHKSKP